MTDTNQNHSQFTTLSFKRYLLNDLYTHTARFILLPKANIAYICNSHFHNDLIR